MIPTLPDSAKPVVKRVAIRYPHPNLDDPMLPRSYRVHQVKRETQDTFTLEIEGVEPDGPVPFLPGQFNMLYLFGMGEVPISISSDPALHGRMQHTTREVGVVTGAMHALKRGDTLGVRGPFGTHWPVDELQGRDIVIVSGGIGLAPLRPALYRILARREQYGKVVLLYGTRSPNDILFKNELQKWRSQFDMDVYITVDRAVPSWRGNVGVVTSLIQRSPFDPHTTTALVCGPEVMMRFAVLELQKRGVAAEDVFVSMERNMKCGVGLCGHCQAGPQFVCKDGPVFRYDKVQSLFNIWEV